MQPLYFRVPRAPGNPFGTVTTPLFTTILASIGVFFTTTQRYEILSDNIANMWRLDRNQFDFIVIGGGSAGGVVAARLSEKYSVLLLEAGGDMNDVQQIPAMGLLLLTYPEVDWNHKTVPQKYACYALPENRSHWSQGKGLGGTSNINLLIQSRGNPKDFDHWANLTGDDSWNYENVLPYFKKSEDYKGRWSDSRAHGKDGPITVQVPDYTGIADIFVEAAKELGYPRADLNGFFTQGFDTVFYPIKDGRRFGVYGAYINANRNRTNLTIRKFSYVKKILIDNEKRAYAVEYDRHGEHKTVFVHKEVILSAGWSNSPKLLMLSGIGPKDHLESMGIPVVVDLPVGQHLQDHISTYIGPFFVSQPIAFAIERDVINALSVAEFFTQGTGLLTTTGAQAMGFFTSNYTDDPDWPDLQLILAGVNIGKDFPIDMARGFGIKEHILKQYYKHAIGKNSFFMAVSVARPKARGYIQLQSTDPYDELIINPNYLDNEHDMKVMIEGIKKAIELIEGTSAFRSIEGKFTDKVFPGCESVPFRSDAYWECYARHYSVTLHHIVGSCSMGKVVDTQLRVAGIRGLRVIDASVMPSVPVGNTNVPAIMIGEKGADMIMEFWKPYTK